MSSFVDELILFALKIVMKTHSFSYGLAGFLAQKVEKDG
ncbi:unnamed protein product, partial [marine sediment metagenome]